MRNVPEKLELRLKTAPRDHLVALVRDLYCELAEQYDFKQPPPGRCDYCGAATTQLGYISDTKVWPACCRACIAVYIWEPIPLDKCPKSILDKIQAQGVKI